MINVIEDNTIPPPLRFSLKHLLTKGQASICAPVDETTENTRSE